MADILNKIKTIAGRLFGAPETSARTSAASLSSHAAASYADPSMAHWTPGAYSADADLLPDLPTLTARSRDLSRNNGLMSAAIQTLCDNIIGSTQRLNATPDYRLLDWTLDQSRDWSNTTEAKFRSWADSTACDATDTQTLLGLSHQALRGCLLNGDAIALPLWLPEPGADWSTRLMLLESDRLCTPTHLQNTDNIRGGIEYNPHGQPIAYHILRRHPGDIFMYGSRATLEWDRIPAKNSFGRRQVIHLHDKERTGQSRGKPIATVIMRELRMAGDYAHNELSASVTNSIVAAFLETDLDTNSASALFGQDPSTTWAQNTEYAKASGLTTKKMSSGGIVTLPPGTKINTIAPGRPNASFEAFMLASLRNIAAGLNIPYELLVKDFSKTSYSSARASMLEAWRYFNNRRRWLTETWLKPVYELWLEEAINTGHIQAPNYYSHKYAYSRARFIFGGRGWVDPVKEAQAALIRIQAGLSTMEKECAEQGEDYEEILDQQAIEMAMRKERGLPAINPQAITGQQQQNQPTPSEDKTDKTGPEADDDLEDPKDNDPQDSQNDSPDQSVAKAETNQNWQHETKRTYPQPSQASGLARPYRTNK